MHHCSVCAAKRGQSIKNKREDSHNQKSCLQGTKPMLNNKETVFSVLKTLNVSDIYMYFIDIYIKVSDIYIKVDDLHRI